MLKKNCLLCGLGLFLLGLPVFGVQVSFLHDIDRISVSERPFFSAITGVNSVSLARPIAVAAQGNLVYIADEELKEIYVYNRASDSTVLLRNVYSQLSSTPKALYVNDFLDLFVLDSFGRKVIRFDNQGNNLMTYSNGLNLNSPQGMCINPLNQHVFIADGLYGHIIEFGGEGRAYALHKVPDAELMQAGYRLVGLACDHDHMYALSAGHAEVLVFSFTGELVARIERQQVREPASIALDSYGRIYVTDRYDDTIKVYTLKGYDGLIGGLGSDAIVFRNISSIWIDGMFLYVTDTGNRRIQVLLINPPN